MYKRLTPEQVSNIDLNDLRVLITMYMEACDQGLKPRGSHVEASWGRRYVLICRVAKNGAAFCHSFIDLKTGDLLPALNPKGPPNTKNSLGNLIRDGWPLLSQYNLL